MRCNIGLIQEEKSIQTHLQKNQVNPYNFSKPKGSYKGTGMMIHRRQFWELLSKTCKTHTTRERSSLFLHAHYFSTATPNPNFLHHFNLISRGCFAYGALCFFGLCYPIISQPTNHTRKFSMAAVYNDNTHMR